MEKIILFDLDGTLIDSTEAILESFDIAFTHFGDAVPEEEQIKAQIGHPLDMMFESLGVEKTKVWEYVAVYKEHYRKISKAKTFLLPDAKEAVVLAKSCATLGVVTTKTAQYSVELLEHMGLMHYFDVLIGREDVTHPKPDPEPIHKALSKLPCVTNNIWMIGDTPMDMLAAKAARINSVGLTCGYGTFESLESCTDNIFENVLDAVTFIAKI